MMPRPPAEFSPLAMTTSGSNLRLDQRQHRLDEASAVAADDVADQDEAHPVTWHIRSPGLRG